MKGFGAKAIVCIWIAMLILTAAVAVSDWHPRSLDKHCAFCQLRASAVGILFAIADLSLPSATGWLAPPTVFVKLQDTARTSVTSRGPPLVLPSFS